MLKTDVHFRHILSFVLAVIMIFVCPTVMAESDALSPQVSSDEYVGYSLGAYKYFLPSEWEHDYSEEFQMNYHYETGDPLTGGYITSSAMEIGLSLDASDLSFDIVVDAVIDGMGVDDYDIPSDLVCPAVSNHPHRAIRADYVDNGVSLTDIYWFMWYDNGYLYTFSYLNFTAESSDSVSDFNSVLSTIVFDPSAADTQNADEFPVVAYRYNSSKYYYLCLAITNNTTRTVKIDVSVQFFDADGGLVGVDDAHEYAFCPGTEMLIVTYNDLPFDSYNLDINTSNDTYYSPVVSDLVVETTLVGNKAIIAVTNNGSISAEFVEYDILFLDGDDVVTRTMGYIIDGDNEIKPGKTQYAEENCSYEFDDVLVFLKGFGEK